MTLSDLDRLLRATLPGQGGRLSVTVTDLPTHESGVRDLLAKAVDMAALKGARLVEISLPLGRFPAFGSKYRGVPVRDCGRSGVLRLVYDSETVTIAA
ncbi:MAG: hypothetical protein JWN07_1525 [Hyphomicrobiales bacterium]|nr:hypothetical protein [Hyphomicrobiales bacterium]